MHGRAHRAESARVLGLRVVPWPCCILFFLIEVSDGAGVHVAGNDSRIEGNNCTGSDRGIYVDAAGNIIIKNTCSGNTINWDIAIGNAVAPIVSATTNGAAISGNTYTGSLGSTDPNANFSY